ncbi:MAG: trimeric autotransporter adhesin [Acetobacteraceae bacterium]|nr:trimeric autotransporter adhesin [Acetobacteraceae bacterium]
MGVKFDVILNGPGGSFDFASQLKSLMPPIDTLVQSDPGSVFSLEGPNELNGGYPVYYNGVASNTNGTVADQIMQAIDSMVVADPNLASIPILNASLGGNSDWQTYAQQEGNMSAYIEQANYHVYPTEGEQPGPSDSLSFAAKMAWTTAPALPLAFTETGYPTAYGIANGNDVDQLTQAKNILNELADAYQLGAQQTYIYELMDGAANPAPGDDEDGFGLFTSTGAPKLAATAIHNLTSILSDTAANAQTFTTGSLSYAISNLPQTGNSLLLEKSGGTFDLMLWNEAPDWNPVTQTDITVTPTTSIISFGNTYGTVEIFDPLNSSTPVQIVNNTSQVSVSLTDHPLIIEIEQSSNPAPTPIATPTPTPAATAYITVTPNGGSASSISGNKMGKSTAGGDTFSITAPGSAKVVLGSMPGKIQFIGMSHVVLTEGSGNAVVTSNGGSNTWTAGIGSLEVSGGSGADTYVYRAGVSHTGNGRLTVDDFSAAKGDVLDITRSLKKSMTIASDGKGGTLLSFASGGGVDLKGITTNPINLIHWT